VRVRTGVLGGGSGGEDPRREQGDQQKTHDKDLNEKRSITQQLTQRRDSFNRRDRRTAPLRPGVEAAKAGGAPGRRGISTPGRACAMHQASASQTAGPA
jgi:hypothetical protein